VNLNIGCTDSNKYQSFTGHQKGMVLKCQLFLLLGSQKNFHKVI